jgi:phage tail-like protein
MTAEVNPSYLYTVYDFPTMNKMAEFESLTGGEIKVAMIPYTCVDKNGVSETKYVTGATTYSPIVLVHALNLDGQALNNWLVLASTGDRKKALKNINIVMLDMTGKKIVTWDLINALPSGISGFSFNQHTQGGLYYTCHELTINVERIEMHFG